MKEYGGNREKKGREEATMANVKCTFPTGFTSPVHSSLFSDRPFTSHCSRQVYTFIIYHRLHILFLSSPLNSKSTRVKNIAFCKAMSRSIMNGKSNVRFTVSDGLITEQF